jgi:MFS family permease
MASAASTHDGLQVKTFAAMQHPNFRIYFAGQLISLSGTWMQTVAQGWLIFHLTRDEFMLGLVACIAGLPALLLSPVAGVFVDRFPRRNTLILSNLLLMLVALILAALTFNQTIATWHVLALALLTGIANAVDAPSRQSIIADLVGHKDLNSGIVLNSTMFNISRIIGPAVGGVILYQFGPAWCFLLNALSFIAVITTLLLLRLKRNPPQNTTFAPLARLREGWQFARHHEVIAPLLILAVIASALTTNISQVMPAFADTVLDAPDAGLAILSTAAGVGSAIAALSMMTLSKRFGRGRVVTAMLVFTAISTTLAANMTEVWAAALFIACYGFGVILLFVTVNTLIQSQVPDAFRGRVLSLYTLTFFGVGPFGALLLGFLARYISTPTAMTLYAVLGGLLSLVVIARARHIIHLT